MIRSVYSCLRTEAVTWSLFQNVVLKRKHLYQSLILKNVGGFKSGTLSNKKLRHKHFPVIFSKIFKNTYILENFWIVSSASTLNGPTESYIQGTPLENNTVSLF